MAVRDSFLVFFRTSPITGATGLTALDGMLPYSLSLSLATAIALSSVSVPNAEAA